LKKPGQVRIKKKSEQYTPDPVHKIERSEDKPAAPSTPDGEQDNQQQCNINPIHKIIFCLSGVSCQSHLVPTYISTMTRWLQKGTNNMP